MGRDVRCIRELTAVYDSLIYTARMNLGKKVKVEWGTWMPTERGLKTLMSRRNKLNKGV